MRIFQGFARLAYTKRKTKCRIDYLDGGVFLVIENFLLWLAIDNRGGLAYSCSANSSTAIGRDKVWALEILSATFIAQDPAS